MGRDRDQMADVSNEGAQVSSELFSYALLRSEALGAKGEVQVSTA